VAVIERLKHWLVTMLLCIDQFMQCWIRGWYYVWVGGDRPSADETISAWVGKSLRAGKRWAHYAAAAIDFLFGAGHCLRAIESDDLD
jgi:hypothetical protein